MKNKLKMVEDSKDIRKYELEDGVVIVIKIVDCFDEVTIKVTTDTEEDIGQIELIMREDEGDYYITWMYLDKSGNKFTQRGIGRQALLFFKDHYDVLISAAENDGMERDDGSHLTGDGPGFVEKLRLEGIIEPSQDTPDDEDIFGE